MAKKKIAVYVIIPLILNLVLILAYFSGVPWLQRLVSPTVFGMHPDTGRELGLLENLQNGLLLAILVILAFGIQRKSEKIERLVFACLLVFSLFVFLEEIDYGLHYYEYARGVPFWRAAQIRNVHNISGTTKVIKNLVDVGMGVLFVVLPLAFAKSTRPLFRYVTPDRFAIFTMIVMVCTSKLAHLLKDLDVGTRGSIHKNISEFRELTIYYLFVIYLATIVFGRTLAPGPAPADTAESGGQEDV